MFDDDFALFFEDSYDTVSNKDGLSLDQSWCQHVWIGTQLIFSTVYDCKLCKCKKEEWERENNIPKWGGL
jgi:hypothetical protein